MFHFYYKVLSHFQTLPCQKPILPYDASMPRLIFLSLRATVGSAAIPVVKRGCLRGALAPLLLFPPLLLEERPNIPGSFRGAKPLFKKYFPLPLIKGKGDKGG